MDEAESLFGRYLAKELNYALRRFDFETSLRWREQILENKDKVVSALRKNLERGQYNGYYRYKG